MMKCTRKVFITKAISACLAAAVIVGTAGQGNVQAMLAPASAGQPVVERQANDAATRASLERRLIQQRLKDLGYESADIDRVNRLSDAQVHQMAMSIDKQVAAGDSGTTLAIIAGTVILMILLIRAVYDDDDDDDDDDRRTEVDVDDDDAPAPAAAPPQTIIVR